MMDEPVREWRVMAATVQMREPLTWVVREGNSPWSVNHQDGQALADYLNALEKRVREAELEANEIREIMAVREVAWRHEKEQAEARAEAAELENFKFATSIGEIMTEANDAKARAAAYEQALEAASFGLALAVARYAGEQERRGRSPVQYEKDEIWALMNSPRLQANEVLAAAALRATPTEEKSS